jgi:glycine/D-amino acid oxidase-like deaminating enzyme
VRIGIVGAGLFGCIISTHLRSLGHQTVLFDDRREGGGSRPAACLMKPGWLSKVPRLLECLELLDRHYGVHNLSFRVNNLLNQTVHWVDPARVLSVSGVYDVEVEMIYDNRVSTTREMFEFDRVIVCAGVWTRKLCPHVPVEARWGAAFLWRDRIEDVLPPFISQWAPYKQIVAFQRGDGLWVGDGSALKSWSPEAEQKSLLRCQEKVDIHTPPTVLRGQRPYVGHTPNNEPCWLEQRGKMIIATGGAKNGTAAAAYSALRIGEWLGQHRD